MNGSGWQPNKYRNRNVNGRDKERNILMERSLNVKEEEELAEGTILYDNGKGRNYFFFASAAFSSFYLFNFCK